MAADDVPREDLDELWNEFHAVVNMTSRELSEWLKTRSSGEETEELPDKAGPPKGRRVLDVLGKRRCDLDSDDLRIMRKVVDTVTAERGVDMEPTAGQAPWRHRLMSLGHDPLKPVVSGGPGGPGGPGGAGRR
ncbi:DUF3140 domain-containing protein [Streptomyces sp. NPDC050560]|uniref:DUF3140 domain-containing protein n=1 Tax=Streptomyces sp. NPDC050560 TaxID=3365630 RepID=UPI00378CE3FE